MWYQKSIWFATQLDLEAGKGMMNLQEWSFERTDCVRAWGFRLVNRAMKRASTLCGRSFGQKTTYRITLFCGFFYQRSIGCKQGRETMREVQGSPKVCFPGLVYFVTAVAYHFCLNFPRAFTQSGKTSFEVIPLVRHFCKGKRIELWRKF